MAQSPCTKVNILIVDDHPALAYGAQLALQQNERTRTVEVAVDGQMALEMLARLNPTVVVLDLSLPDTSGIELARIIRRSTDAHIVVYTGDEKWASCLPALLELGISGIVHKRHAIDYLERAIEGALNGYAAIPLDMFSSLRCIATDEDDVVKSMQPRDVRLLEFIDKGYTNQEMAEELFVSPKTIENYLTQLYKTLRVSSRREAVVLFKALQSR